MYICILMPYTNYKGSRIRMYIHTESKFSLFLTANFNLSSPVMSTMKIVTV